MNNRFRTHFFHGLPSVVKTVITPEKFFSLTRNPQALVSLKAQTELKGFFRGFGSYGTTFYEQVMQALRQALCQGISHVFSISLGRVIIAFLVNLFIRELPLRKHHVLAESIAGDKIRLAPESIKP
jgi:hypothetical protein